MNASVRIGVTGTGQKPYYRVFLNPSERDDVILGSYYDNHEPLENGFSSTNNWSSRSMSLEKLLAFYADAIRCKGKKSKDSSEDFVSMRRPVCAILRSLQTLCV